MSRVPPAAANVVTAIESGAVLEESPESGIILIWPDGIIENVRPIVRKALLDRGLLRSKRVKKIVEVKQYTLVPQPEEEIVVELDADGVYKPMSEIAPLPVADIEAVLRRPVSVANGPEGGESHG